MPEPLYWRRGGGKSVMLLGRGATEQGNRGVPLDDGLSEQRWRTPLIATAYAHMEVFAAVRLPLQQRIALMQAVPEIFRARWLPFMQLEATDLRAALPGLLDCIAGAELVQAMWLARSVTIARRAGDAARGGFLRRSHGDCRAQRARLYHDLLGSLDLRAWVAACAGMTLRARRRHTAWRRTDLRGRPTLVGLKPACARDRCGDHARFVAEFDHDKTERGIELQAGVRPDRGRGGLLRFGGRVGGNPGLASRLRSGNGRGDRGDTQVVRHGGIDRSSRAVLAPGTCQYCAYTG